jgi:hypothetical protein
MDANFASQPSVQWIPFPSPPDGTGQELLSQKVDALFKGQPGSSVSLHQANPLAFTRHLYSADSQTQHRFFLLCKTNLSPPEETLKNAADLGGGINVIVQKPIEI